MIGEVPVQFIQALPYVLTVHPARRLHRPGDPAEAGGVPYVKER